MAKSASRVLRREKSETTLETLIELFVASKQIEGRSRRTLTWYGANLKRFADFVSEGEPARLKDLSLHDARAFIAYLQSRTTRYEEHSVRPVKSGGLSPHTIHGYVRTLKAFGAWLLEEGFTSHHLFRRLNAPKLPQPMIQILSDQEISQILDAINPNSFLGARLHAMVLLLLDTGIRASELCSLTVDNTYIHEGYVKVRGKGDKERMVPFGTTTKKALIRYLHMFRPVSEGKEPEALILSVDGTPLTYEGLHKALRRLGRTAGVDRLHAHLFRHTFSVHYLMNGGDVMTLKLILGHTSLEVTQMYMHLAEAHVQVQHSRFSPVDRLGFSSPRKRKGS